MLWPFSAPKQFKISKRSGSIPLDSSIDDVEILDSILLVNLNILIMLTRTRILIYNYKPMALVATYFRTSKSVEEMGLNKSLFHSTNLHHSIPQTSNQDINHSNSDKIDQFMAWYHGKITFHCLTDKNIILTFQILKDSSQLTTFREYGLPIINSELLNNELEQDIEFNMDDDLLVVYDEHNSSKILQNGIITSKDVGLMQMIFHPRNKDHSDSYSGYDDTNGDNSISIKSVEMILKAVFNFDYDIIDILGFKQFYSTDNELDNRIHNFSENLFILSSYGLQILKLDGSKLKDRKLIKLTNGFKILHCNNNLFVASDANSPFVEIHKINIENESIQETIAINNTEKIIDIIPISTNLFLFVSPRKLIHFDIESKEITYQFETPFTIKLINKTCNNSLLLISDENTMLFYTIFGNLYFSTEYDKDDSMSYPLFDYTDFSFFDNILVTMTKTGHYQAWEFWKESLNTQFNFRTFNSNILYHGNNILYYSPQSDSNRNTNNGSIINLSSKTENNNISLVKTSGNMKLLATYVNNKEILRIKNLETNTWYWYPDMKIVDMYWLGNNYLVLDTILENDVRALQCINVPLQIPLNKELHDLVIWDFAIPNDLKVYSIHVNSLSRYKPIKIRSKSTNQLKEGKFYKTAEIILITNKSILIFDVISTVLPNGINLIKKIFQYKKIGILKNSLSLSNINWAMTYKDELLVYSHYKFYKIGNLEADHWKIIELFDNVEKIVDTYLGSIMFIKGKQFIICTIDELMNAELETININIDEDNYPLSLSLKTATINSLHTVFNKNFCRNVMKHKIFLDKLIEYKLRTNCPIDQITRELHTSKHYKFALEKILSLSILENKDITKIIELVKSCPSTNVSVDADGEHIHKYSDMLEIIGNCLRKIEMKHWNILFKKLNMTPRDLLQYCIEGDEAKMLGVLLLVFLNYNEAELIHDLKTANEETESNNSSKSSISVLSGTHEENAATNTTNDTVGNKTKSLSDDELMLRVLEILVRSASKATDRVRAQETWDMCFQLVAFLRNLDRQNGSQLVQKALEFI